jgi:hypothetical protein
MKKYATLRSVVLVLFIIVACFTVYAKFIYKPRPYFIPQHLDENFDERLLDVNTIEKLTGFVTKKFEETGHDTARMVRYIDLFLRNRFYHSYSEYNLRDNWIAYLCGKYIWLHFLNPVIEEDIIKAPMAGCSQQGILFQNQLNRLGIKCSSIQFYPLPYQKSGHYAISAYYGSSWHYFDSNLEPAIIDSTMPSIEQIIARQLYVKMYTKPVHRDFKEYFINKNYARVPTDPHGKLNMYYFQVFTKFLSNWLWLIFLLLYGALWLIRPR